MKKQFMILAIIFCLTIGFVSAFQLTQCNAPSTSGCTDGAKNWKYYFACTPESLCGPVKAARGYALQYTIDQGFSYWASSTQVWNQLSDPSSCLGLSPYTLRGFDKTTSSWGPFVLLYSKWNSDNQKWDYVVVSFNAGSVPCSACGCWYKNYEQTGANGAGFIQTTEHSFACIKEGAGYNGNSNDQECWYGGVRNASACYNGVQCFDAWGIGAGYGFWGKDPDSSRKNKVYRVEATDKVFAVSGPYNAGTATGKIWTPTNLASGGVTSWTDMIEGGGRISNSYGSDTDLPPRFFSISKSGSHQIASYGSFQRSHSTYPLTGTDAVKYSTTSGKFQTTAQVRTTPSHIYGAGGTTSSRVYGIPLGNPGNKISYFSNSNWGSTAGYTTDTCVGSSSDTGIRAFVDYDYYTGVGWATRGTSGGPCLVWSTLAPVSVPSTCSCTAYQSTGVCGSACSPGLTCSGYQVCQMRTCTPNFCDQTHRCVTDYATCGDVQVTCRQDASGGTGGVKGINWWAKAYIGTESPDTPCGTESSPYPKYNVQWGSPLTITTKNFNYLNYYGRVTLSVTELGSTSGPKYINTKSVYDTNVDGGATATWNWLTSSSWESSPFCKQGVYLISVRTTFPDSNLAGHFTQYWQTNTFQLNVTYSNTNAPNGQGCTSCSCSAWMGDNCYPDGAASTCSLTYPLHQWRICEAGCDSESRCIGPSEGGYCGVAAYCENSTIIDCGSNSCGEGQISINKVCYDSLDVVVSDVYLCQDYERCTEDWACGDWVLGACGVGGCDIDQALVTRQCVARPGDLDNSYFERQYCLDNGQLFDGIPVNCTLPPLPPLANFTWVFNFIPSNTVQVDQKGVLFQQTYTNSINQSYYVNWQYAACLEPALTDCPVNFTGSFELLGGTVRSIERGPDWTRGISPGTYRVIFKAQPSGASFWNEANYTWIVSSSGANITLGNLNNITLGTSLTLPIILTDTFSRNWNLQFDFFNYLGSQVNVAVGQPACFPSGTMLCLNVSGIDEEGYILCNIDDVVACPTGCLDGACTDILTNNIYRYALPITYSSSPSGKGYSFNFTINGAPFEQGRGYSVVAVAHTELLNESDFTIYSDFKPFHIDPFIANYRLDMSISESYPLFNQDEVIFTMTPNDLVCDPSCKTVTELSLEFYDYNPVTGWWDILVHRMTPVSGLSSNQPYTYTFPSGGWPGMTTGFCPYTTASTCEEDSNCAWWAIPTCIGDAETCECILAGESGCGTGGSITYDQASFCAYSANGLRPGRTYAVQSRATFSDDNSVPSQQLFLNVKDQITSDQVGFTPITIMALGDFLLGKTVERLYVNYGTVYSSASSPKSYICVSDLDVAGIFEKSNCLVGLEELGVDVLSGLAAVQTPDEDLLAANPNTPIRALIYTGYELVGGSQIDKVGMIDYVKKTSTGIFFITGETQGSLVVPVSNPFATGEVGCISNPVPVRCPEEIDVAIGIGIDSEADPNVTTSEVYRGGGFAYIYYVGNNAFLECMGASGYKRTATLPISTWTSQGVTQNLYYGNCMVKGGITAVDKNMDGYEEILGGGGIIDLIEKSIQYRTGEDRAIIPVDVNSDGYIDFVSQEEGLLEVWMGTSQYIPGYSNTLEATSISPCQVNTNGLLTATINYRGPGNFGDYEFEMDYGDGTSDVHVASTNPSANKFNTHIYQVVGEYNVTGTVRYGSESSSVSCIASVTKVTSTYQYSGNISSMCSIGTDGLFTTYSGSVAAHGWTVIGNAQNSIAGAGILLEDLPFEMYRPIKTINPVQTFNLRFSSIELLYFDLAYRARIQGMSTMADIAKIRVAGNKIYSVERGGGVLPKFDLLNDVVYDISMTVDSEAKTFTVLAGKQGESLTVIYIGPVLVSNSYDLLNGEIRFTYELGAGTLQILDYTCSGVVNETLILSETELDLYLSGRLGDAATSIFNELKNCDPNIDYTGAYNIPIEFTLERNYSDYPRVGAFCRSLQSSPSFQCTYKDLKSIIMKYPGCYKEAHSYCVDVTFKKDMSQAGTTGDGVLSCSTILGMEAFYGRAMKPTLNAFSDLIVENWFEMAVVVIVVLVAAAFAGNKRRR